MMAPEMAPELIPEASCATPETRFAAASDFSATLFSGFDFEFDLLAAFLLAGGLLATVFFFAVFLFAVFFLDRAVIWSRTIDNPARQPKSSTKPFAWLIKLP